MWARVRREGEGANVQCASDSMERLPLVLYFLRRCTDLPQHSLSQLTVRHGHQREQCPGILPVSCALNWFLARQPISPNQLTATKPELEGVRHLASPSLCTYGLTNKKPELEFLLGPSSRRAGRAWILF